MTTQEIQREIKGSLERLNWSQADFIAEYNEIRKRKPLLEVEAFKKQLSRDTTNVNLLKDYLNFIHSHKAWVALGYIKPVFTSAAEIEPSLFDEIKRISGAINKPKSARNPESE